MKRKRKLNFAELMLPVAGLALLAIAVLSLWRFEKRSSADIKEQAVSALHLQEIAAEQSTQFKLRVDGAIRELEAAGTLIRDTNQEELSVRLTEIKSQGGFERVAVLNREGSGFYEDGSRASVTDWGLENGTLPGIFCIGDPDEGKIGLSVSMKNGERLCAVCPESMFKLSVEGNGNGSYAFVTRPDGQIVVGSDHPGYSGIVNNVVSFYGDVVIENGIGVEDVAADLKKGKNGVLVYTYGNQYKYVIYQPVGIEDWRLFSVTDGNRVTRIIEIMREQLLRLTWELLILAALFAAILLVRSKKWKKRLGDQRQMLTQSNELRAIAERMSYTILFEADLSTGEIVFNDAFERQLGHKPQFTNLNDLLKIGEEELPEKLRPWRRLAEDVKRGLNKSQMSIQVTDSRGESVWYRASFQTLYNWDKMAPGHVVGRLANIEWQEREQDKQLVNAEQDGLTGLLGHRAFMKKAERQLERGDGCALLIVDIDGFKAARDMNGQYQGDRLLVRMSESIRRVFTERDVQGRLGGDSFAVFMTGKASAEDVAKRAEALLRIFEENAGGCTCSVGISMIEQDTDSMSEVSRRADKALYRAKLAGKRKFEFYQKPSDQREDKRHQSGDINLTLNRLAVGLLTCDALPVGMDEALRVIARYYGAMRAFVLQKDQNGQGMREVYSWYEPGNEPEEEFTLPLSGGMAVAQALEEKRTMAIPVINPETVPDEALREKLKSCGVNALYMVPLTKAGGAEGFVGVVNPMEHVGSASLLKQAANCIGSALVKFQKQPL